MESSLPRPSTAFSLTKLRAPSDLQTDPHQVLYVSPAFDSTWGFPAERLYQDPEFRMLCIHPEDRSRVAAAFADWIQGNTSTYLVEYRIMHPNGSVR
jgi:hypothetical protein